MNKIKEPLKSDLLNGKWELLYTTSQSVLQTQVCWDSHLFSFILSYFYCIKYLFFLFTLRDVYITGNVFITKLSCFLSLIFFLWSNLNNQQIWLQPTWCFESFSHLSGYRFKYSHSIVEANMKSSLLLTCFSHFFLYSFCDYMILFVFFFFYWSLCSKSVGIMRDYL